MTVKFITVSCGFVAPPRRLNWADYDLSQLCDSVADMQQHECYGLSEQFHRRMVEKQENPSHNP